MPRLASLKEKLKEYLIAQKASPLQLDADVLSLGLWRPHEKILIEKWLQEEYPKLAKEFEISADDAQWLKMLTEQIPKGPNLSQGNVDKSWLKFWGTKKPAGIRKPLDEIKRALPKGRCSGSTVAECAAALSLENSYPTHVQIDETYAALLKEKKVDDEKAVEMNNVLKFIFRMQYSREELSIYQTDFEKLCPFLTLLGSYSLPFTQEIVARAIDEIFLAQRRATKAEEKSPIDGLNHQFVFMQIVANGHATLLTDKTNLHTGGSLLTFSDANSWKGRIPGIEEKDAKKTGAAVFYSHQFSKQYPAFSIRLYGYNIKNPVQLPTLATFLASLPVGFSIPWTRMFAEAIRIDSLEAMNYCKLQANLNNVCDDGTTLLHFAASVNKPFAIAEMVKLGCTADVNAVTKTSGRTALHKAANFGFDEVIKALLALTPKPNVNIKMSDHAPRRAGYTPLHIAAEAGHLSTAKLLINANAEIFEEDKEGLTPFERAKSSAMLEMLAAEMAQSRFLGDDRPKLEVMLEKACLGKNLRVVTALLSANVNLPQGLSAREFLTPVLMDASRVGNLRAVDLLVDAGADITKTDIKGMNAFHAAVDAGHLYLVHYFLKVNPAVVRKSINHWQNGLEIAVEKDFTAIVKLMSELSEYVPKMVFCYSQILSKLAKSRTMHILLQNIAASYVQTGATLPIDELFYALSANNYSYVSMLMRLGVSANSLNQEGDTALMKVQSAVMAKMLLANRADVTAKNSLGETALHKAVNSDDALVEVLLEAKAPINASTLVGETALHYAAGNEFMPAVLALLNHQADVNAKTKRGKLPIDFAKKGPVRDVLARTMAAQSIRLGDHAEVSRLLEKYKPDINFPLADNNKLILLAAQLGDVKIMRALKHHQRNILTGSDAQQALLIAMQNNHRELVDYLQHKRIIISPAFAKTNSLRNHSILFPPGKTKLNIAYQELKDDQNEERCAIA